MARKFLQNAWYVAGYPEELDGGALLSRRLLGEPVLLFRDGEGKVAAIADRCPHRFVPLSMGRLAEGQVRCGYHGLGFDRSGKCVHNPHGPTAGLAVRAWPISEQAGLLWIWMGDPDRAADTGIPAFEQVDPASHHIRHGYLHGRAHYELMTDNILDLSHIEFLHPGLGTEAVSRAKVEVRQENDAIITVRQMRDELLPPGLDHVYQAQGARVHRTLAVTWRAPALMALQVTIEPADPAAAWRTGSQTLHLFTPETDASTHYFYVASLPRASADSETADGFMNALSRVFVGEDKPMIDAQAAMLGGIDIMDMKPALLAIDKAPVLARRALAKRIAAENA